MYETEATDKIFSTWEYLKNLTILVGLWEILYFICEMQLKKFKSYNYCKYHKIYLLK